MGSSCLKCAKCFLLPNSAWWKLYLGIEKLQLLGFSIDIYVNFG